MVEQSERPATKLEQQLTGEGLSAAQPIDVLREARRKFLRGQRLDMQELAADMGVSRATLYRWVGGRDQLLGEIIWSLGELGLNEAKDEAKDLSGVEKILHVYERFGELTAAHGPTRRFVESEPETALRVMTTKASANQARVIDFYQRLLDEEVAKGLQLRFDTETLAFVMVRVGESFLWTNLITGQEPEMHRAHEIVRVLLT